MPLALWATRAKGASGDGRALLNDASSANLLDGRQREAEPPGVVLAG